MLPRDKGYIYVRNHWSYDRDGICKLGKTRCIPERHSVYITGEPIPGYFSLVFEVDDDSWVEKNLQKKLSSYNKTFVGGGTEFFDKRIMGLIEPCLEELCIPYRTLSPQEIDELVRCTRVRQPINTITKSPRDYQKNIIDKSCDWFRNNDKGILVLPCGVGKTMISLWITQQLRCNTVLIGVPNIILQPNNNGSTNIVYNSIYTKYKDIIKI